MIRHAKRCETRDMDRDRRVAARAFVVWLVIIGVESVHGTLRVVWLAPRLGDFRARQVAVFSGSVPILAIALLFVRWIGAESTRALLSIGTAWLALTLLFEIGLGRWVFGRSWEDLASDFEIWKGGLFPIGLLVLLLAPLIAVRLRNICKQDTPV
jgi:hypothetical protein